MKLLLTGASGFVGSHILDGLRSKAIPVALLLRPSAHKRLQAARLDPLEIRTGSLTDPESLARATEGITHVIHCAGCVKALRGADFYEVNQNGTRNLLEALRLHPRQLQRFVLISSLAASGPAVPPQPAREQDPPHPVSDYGKSKLAGEAEVRRHCPAEYTILRPAAVYGPRDTEFLRLFKAIKAHLRPRPALQPLSLLFVKDLAEAAVAALDSPAAAGKTYFVASPEVVNARQMAGEIARQMGTWTVPLPLPTAALWPVCLVQECLTRLSGNANMLSLQKFAELRAPGWVCDPALLRRETGCECRTSLSQGISQTLTWYREEAWL